MFPGQSYSRNRCRSSSETVRIGPVVALRVLGDEEVGELQDFVAPLAQRRHDRLDHLEPVIQVLAELAAQHHRLEVAVRGGDDADVDFDLLVAAKLGELRVLQHVEQLGLERRLHLADLVEEDRAEVRLLELADARRRGAGERAFLVAEQLAFEQLRRQRRAVHLDERLVLARRSLMDGARDELLADAALAADQHGDVAVGHLLDDVRHLTHGRAVAPAEERLVLIVAELPPQTSVSSLTSRLRSIACLMAESSAISPSPSGSPGLTT